MERLAVIVPYRNREEHLKEFIPYMERFLSDDEIDYEIFIVEQTDDKPFNRAKLLNVGFKEAQDFNYFAFHDVDMLPLDSDYSYPEDGPTHLASEVEQFNWGLAYEEYFGGVTLFDKESFLKINGYANEYWGWGGEDDDIYHRCCVEEISVSRKDCRYRSLNHERKIEAPLYGKNLSKIREFQSSNLPKKLMQEDGLSTLVYEKTGEEKIAEKSRILKVKL